MYVSIHTNGEHFTIVLNVGSISSHSAVFVAIVHFTEPGSHFLISLNVVHVLLTFPSPPLDDRLPFHSYSPIILHVSWFSYVSMLFPI